jgi:hypothetical protein
MRLYAANQKLRNPQDFDAESVRKFWWDYVPVKERQTLEGDEKPKINKPNCLREDREIGRILPVSHGKPNSGNAARHKIGGILPN